MAAYTAGWMTYGHLQADCLYTGISSGPNARYRVWEAFSASETSGCAWVELQRSIQGFNVPVGWLVGWSLTSLFSTNTAMS